MTTPQRFRLGVRLMAASLLCAVMGAAVAEPSATELAALVGQGRHMYVDGILPSGQPMTAVRSGFAVEGAQAACIACHRKSGLGAVEGDIQVPPITGQALHAGTKLKDRLIVTLDPKRGRAWNQSHPPYTDEALLKALTEGVHVTGRKMLGLMPIYPFTDRELKPLLAYLNQLSSDWSPGVTQDGMHMATVIAPGVDPARVQAFRDTLQSALEQKNSNTMPGHRHMINAAEMMLRIERRWTLDVWELQGPPETWGAQLDAFYARQPVFAIVSGISDSVWDPVQDFCEREAVPCWFPSVAVTPAKAQSQYYGLYFSSGARVEADVVASWLGQSPAKNKHVVQILRDEPAAQAAAAELRAHLGNRAKVDDVVLSGDSAVALKNAFAGLAKSDTVMLWLGPTDFAALGQMNPIANNVIASTRLTHALQPDVPQAWRKTLKLAYPYDLAPMRDFNLATFRSWLKVRSLPVVDEPMQLEVYFSMAYIQYTLSEMLDNVYRDYLIDRGESMIVRREMARAEEETMIRQGGHPPARAVRDSSTLAPGALYGDDPNGIFAQKNTPMIGARQGTTMYPRLSLAPGQRLASKGARIVHMNTEGVLVPDSEWITP